MTDLGERAGFRKAETDSNLRLADTGLQASAATSKRRKLPAFGREIRTMLAAGKTPRSPAGTVTVAVDTWTLCQRWPRIVVDRHDDPANLDFTFLAGRDVLLVWRHGSDFDRIVAVSRELRNAGVRLVEPLAFSRVSA